MVPQFKNLWEKVAYILNDDFIRTTEERHVSGCSKYFD